MDAVLAAASSGSTAAGPGLAVVDLGGGTGGQAVRLARAGHAVSVVDPSGDALAAVARRGAEAGLSDAPGAGSLRGVQGDAETVAESLGTGVADVVVCHGVLEFVEDPAAALVSIAAVLRSGGRLSLRVAQREGAVLAAVAKGQFSRARAIAAEPSGRWGDSDALQHRFDRESVTRLLGQAGLDVQEVRGVRVFGEVAPQPGSVAEAEALEALSETAATQPSFLALAPALHVTAVKAGRPG